jgi:hypothetical protein
MQSGHEIAVVFVQGSRKARETKQPQAANSTMQSTVFVSTDAAERAMAAKRLKTWIPQVNPNDPSHIDAYLLAKDAE